MSLSRLGSLDEYFAEMGGAGSDEMRERVMEQWTRLRCRHDFPFWAATFAYIKRKGGGDDVPFILNRPQRRLVGVLEDASRTASHSPYPAEGTAVGREHVRAAIYGMASACA